MIRMSGWIFFPYLYDVNVAINYPSILTVLQHFLKTKWRREQTACLKPAQSILGDRQHSIVSYEYTSAWKRKQHCKSLAVLSRGLFGLTCSHLINAVCHLCLFVLILDASFAQRRCWRRKVLNCTTVLLPSGRPYAFFMVSTTTTRLLLT